MKSSLIYIFCLVVLLMNSCTVTSDQHLKETTIADLPSKEIIITPEPIVNGLDRAIAGYESFLKESGESPLVPEATRRLADLKLEREYGYVGANNQQPPQADAVSAVEEGAEEPISEAVTNSQPLDLFENQGAKDAIALYRDLLGRYPNYARKDEVLYQMSRAYEEMGEVDEAMAIMNTFVVDCQGSPFFDEVQFRRAEYLFTRRKFLDAEEAYTQIVNLGASSDYYPRALYKLGWTYYKQELYEDGLDRFVALLDYNVNNGTDLLEGENELERKRIADTFRVISLSFSYLGGAQPLVEYFSAHGTRDYENIIYRNLAEYFYEKRRYADAVETYEAFIAGNPYTQDAPLFHIRVIEINTAGGFPTLVLEGKKSFADKYGLNGEYWNHFEVESSPKVIAYLKSDLNDLSRHYHALYQNPKFKDEKEENLQEALGWYHQYLTSFPQDLETPAINYSLAELLLENKSYHDAAVEYEATAYNYALHPKSSQAGYAAVFAYRQELAQSPEASAPEVLEQTIATSIRFAESFPGHAKAPVILGAAVDDLYAIKEFDRALEHGRMLIHNYPDGDAKIVRGAWLVVAHSAYELSLYEDAEAAYGTVLVMTPEDDEARPELVDNLAAAIYQQGSVARDAGDYAAAADHFLRVGELASTSQLRATADYDAAAALIEIADWEKAATVLSFFREHYPEHELQHEITKKMAYVYQHDEQPLLAGQEYERIERESDDPGVRKEALLVAAELYESIPDDDKSLAVYERYLNSFSDPFDVLIEMHHKAGVIFNKRGQQESYYNHLAALIALDAAQGEMRTERSRFLAGHASLTLTELDFSSFCALQIIAPVQQNLQLKQSKMKELIGKLEGLMNYELADVSSAATFYLAETYRNFYSSLMNSERPQDLNDLEREDYEFALEEQAYPFEEKAIAVHQSNMDFIRLGIFNTWIEKSLGTLVNLLPARYGKADQHSDVLLDFGNFHYRTQTPATDLSGSSAEVDDHPDQNKAVL